MFPETVDRFEEAKMKPTHDERLLGAKVYLFPFAF